MRYPLLLLHRESATEGERERVWGGKKKEGCECHVFAKLQIAMLGFVCWFFESEFLPSVCPYKNRSVFFQAAAKKRVAMPQWEPTIAKPHPSDSFQSSHAHRSERRQNNVAELVPVRA